MSAREWRSAALAALGANGSWMCARSSGATENSCSIVRATSIGSETARLREGENGSTSPTPSSRGTPSPVPSSSRAGSSAAARIALRESRTSPADCDGATIST